MGIIQLMRRHHLGKIVGGWLLLISIMAMTSCIGRDASELSSTSAEQSAQGRIIAESDSVSSWCAINRAGDHVSLNEVVPNGSPAVLYFFSPG